jgi:hypothetical protein
MAIAVRRLEDKEFEMFRIIRANHPHNILITIEGRLAGEYVGIAESACGEALSANIPVTVCLSDVMEIDAHGRAFLKRLLVRRARLRAKGVYLRHLVKSLQRSRDLSG